MSPGEGPAGPGARPDAARTRAPLRQDPEAVRLLEDLTRAAARIGTFDWDVAGQQLWWDARFAQTFDLPDDDGVTGEDVVARVHPDDRGRVLAAMREAVERHQGYEAEFRVVRRDGTVRWVAGRGRTLGGPTTTRMVGAVHDVTDVVERRALEERTAGLARRAQLVADVMTELTETLDPEVAVARLAQLVVPTLAEWCIVTLVEDDGSPAPRMRDIGWWHADPDRRDLVAEYANLRLRSLLPGSFLEQALTAREAVVVQPDAAPEVHRVFRPSRARDIIDALAPSAGAVLPIRGRGRTVGLLTLFRGERHGDFTPEELRTCGKVAAAAGLALDTARLYHAQRRIAEGLQRVMLTAPPEPERLRIAVRYVPATEAAQVGGDWYDAFVQADGATVVVVGDVVGHDLVAAAAMGQVRSMLRGIGVATGAGPAPLLTQVDTTIHRLRSRTVASLVVARVEGAGATGRVTVRWSNAGHPPPMVLHPDGRVEVLSADASDLLLGVVPDVARREHTVGLPPGATLLLYTDGLVERRTESLRDGLDRLARTLRGLAGLDPEVLCDEVLARSLPAHADDDVAIVAVRAEPVV